MDLRPRPSTALRVLESIEDPNASLSRLADIISLDPILTSRVIRMANSPLHRRGEDVSSVRPALSKLGTATVQALVAGAALPLLESDADLGPANLWLHSVSVAAAARVASPLLGVVPDVGFTAGMLHDIGAAAIYFADRAEGVPGRPVSPFGPAHAGAGADAAAAYGFPNLLADAIRDHHRPVLAVGRLAQLIILSESIAAAAEENSVEEPTVRLPVLLDDLRLSSRPSRLIDETRRECDRLAGLLEVHQ
ncbi:MAG TPA: HDOD domain-containing protein [Acidimicrobiales bacterium]|nr:HDOD domain-containing protein [Acidimicrobiales bacterium]